MTRATCALCGSPGLDAGEKHGHLRSRPYKLAECSSCGFAWVVDTDDDYEALYDEAYYRGAGADPLVDYARELVDPRTARRYEWRGLRVLAESTGVRAPQTWLDFGGGTGGFTRYLRENGYIAFAYDTGAGAALGRSHGVDVLDASGLALLEGRCDVVSAIEVLEHVPDPVDAVASLARLLRPGGLLIVTTGNLERAPRPLARWGYVMPEIHISFYTPRALRALYARAGLAPVSLAGSSGWNDVVRYKVIKTLGSHVAGGLETAVPWHLAAPLIDRRYGVSAMPSARLPVSSWASTETKP